jgi:hypothetical protein
VAIDAMTQSPDFIRIGTMPLSTLSDSCAFKSDPREETPLPDNIIDEAAGSAIAAFTLAQMSFWAVYHSGLLSKDEAEKMLKLGIDANAKAGPANQKAAAMLLGVLKAVSAAKPATKQ